MPLPSAFAPRLLSRVSGELLRAGLRSGVIAAAATCGALLAFGMGLQRPWLPFNLAAHVVLGSRASLVDGPHTLVTTVGLLVHVVAIMIWALMFVMVVRSRRALIVVPAAIAFAALVFLLNTRLFPVALRPGYESVLTFGQMLFMHFTLAVSLVIGTRLAFSQRA